VEGPDGESGLGIDQPTAKGLLEDDREDEMALVDEWYEACPEASWRWVLEERNGPLTLELTIALSIS
jgi:hypothetical protein